MDTPSKQGNQMANSMPKMRRPTQANVGCQAHIGRNRSNAGMSGNGNESTASHIISNEPAGTNAVPAGYSCDDLVTAYPAAMR